MSIATILTHVILALAAVLLLGQALNRLLSAVGQPRVIGEIAAGILLGPSVLGALWPEASSWLLSGTDGQIKESVISSLKLIAELGACLYMFTVGMELEDARFRRHFRKAFVIANAGIALPFLFGIGLALAIHADRAPEGVSRTSFALFMGVALSITAFPVLARILTDRGIDKSDLGAMSLSCAAIADAIAWCLLAFVVGYDSKDFHFAAYLEGILFYLLAMAFFVRPAMHWLVVWHESGQAFHASLAILGLALYLSAWATSAIGLHAIFGAFLLGVLVPADSKLARDFTLLTRRPTMAILLPAVFAVSGLNTQIGLLTGVGNWLLCAAIIAVAIAGKIGGTTLAAKGTGSDWRTATALGVLMNTRGLMELIVLNIGLNLGVISPTLFAMMVVMALVTTMATSPLLTLILPRSHRKSAD